MRIELAVMLAVTFGVSAVVAVLHLADAVLSGLLRLLRFRLNQDQSRYDLVNPGLNLASIGQLIAWGLLALYLLAHGYWPVRDWAGPGSVGFGRTGRGGSRGAHRYSGTAALLRRPALGLNAEVEPATLHESWWRIPVLVLAAFANGFAEEVVVVGYVITRLRQLGMSQSGAVAVAKGVARLLSPLPGRLCGRLGQCGNGCGLRLLLVPHRPVRAVGDRSRGDRHGGVRRLPAAGRSCGVAGPNSLR